MSKARFPVVKFIRNTPLQSIEGYCRYVVKDLLKEITTSHVLICQWDGYILNADAWRNEWLDYDYIGAIWPDGIVGNGGFSLRSRKLLEALQDDRFNAPFFPEDERICRDWRRELETDFGIRFAPAEVAADFSIEGGRYKGQFGFHSFLTGLPPKTAKPKIFHHSGDHGDIIYALAAVKALGGGVFFIAESDWKVRQPPTPANVRNILALIQQQEYIWSASHTDRSLKHADYDLNNFRKTIIGNPNSGSIFKHHLDAVGASWPQDKPWLSTDFKVMTERPIIVARSARYHNDKFPWLQLVKKYGQRMLFIGSRSEYVDFCMAFGSVPYMETPTLFDAARLIAGSKVFIGNQSCPMAIALGLGVNVIQEVWEPDANCLFQRDNFLAIRGGRVEIPKAWLNSA